MAVKVLTDSGSDFTREEASRLGVEIVPVYIIFGSERLRDGVDIDTATFNRRTGAGESAATEPATIDDYKAAFQRATSDGNEVVMISLSSSISKSYERAHEAAAGFGGKVFVVDSKGASGLECLLVQLAVERAAAGDSAEEIATSIAPAALKHSVFFAVPDMKSLEHSGRLPKAIIALGSMLNVSLMLKMNDAGAIAPAGQSFSFDKTCDMMVEAAVRTMERSPKARFAIAHVEAEETAAKLARLLEEKLGHPPAQEAIRESALTIAAHLGKGAVGIFGIVP
jgi:DegV family protein with EDD domain